MTEQERAAENIRNIVGRAGQATSKPVIDASNNTGILQIGVSLSRNEARRAELPVKLMYSLVVIGLGVLMVLTMLYGLLDTRFPG